MRTKWEEQTKYCINGYFAGDGSISLYMLSRQCFKCNLNGITHSFIVWFCACSSSSCHQNCCWSSTKKRNGDRGRETSLPSVTVSFRNSALDPVLHQQKQPARRGFFRRLPVTVEYENSAAGVSRPLHLVTPGGAGLSRLCLRRKSVNLKSPFSGREMWSVILACLGIPF